MRRRLFTALSVLSLALCVGAAALWSHGASRWGYWYFRPSNEFTVNPPYSGLPAQWYVQWQIGWGRDGRLSVSREVKAIQRLGRHRPGFVSFRADPRWNPLPQALPRPEPWVVEEIWSMDTRTPVHVRKPVSAWSVLGLRYETYIEELYSWPKLGGYLSIAGTRSMAVPQLYLFVLFAILPTIWFRRTWRRRRRSEVICASCGYNLTGNTSGVCPECGTPTAAGVNP